MQRKLPWNILSDGYKESIHILVEDVCLSSRTSFPFEFEFGLLSIYLHSLVWFACLHVQYLTVVKLLLFTGLENFHV